MTQRLRYPVRRLLRVFFAAMLACACASGAAAQALGPQGAENGPNRRQDWSVPSGVSSAPSRAFVLRPSGEGPFRLALIAHASVQNPLRRAMMPQPDYRVLAAWLVSRGFVVVVPERPGHGATGGTYLEDQGGCADADYVRAGGGAADSIAAALGFMRAQDFVRKDGAIVIGHSAGGLGALALAARNVEGLAHIVVFAPGRGGRADDRPHNVCAPDRLVVAAQRFGRGARVPVTWLVARNDTYFSPALSKQMADAFRSSGARVDFRVLPAFGDEGHALLEREGGARVWADAIARVIGP